MSEEASAWCSLSFSWMRTGVWASGRYFSPLWRCKRDECHKIAALRRWKTPLSVRHVVPPPPIFFKAPTSRESCFVWTSAAELYTLDTANYPWAQDRSLSSLLILYLNRFFWGRIENNQKCNRVPTSRGLGFAFAFEQIWALALTSNLSTTLQLSSGTCRKYINDAFWNFNPGACWTNLAFLLFTCEELFAPPPPPPPPPPEVWMSGTLMRTYPLDHNCCKSCG